jgi:hypothetical protein
MLDTRTTSSGGTWRRRVRLALVGSAVALLASACRSGEVCVRPLEDPVAPAAPSTLPEPPPGQDDSPFVLELSAAATELEYAGVVELEILLRSVVDEDLVFPPGSIVPASDGQGLFLETWTGNAVDSESELLRSRSCGGLEELVIESNGVLLEELVIESNGVLEVVTSLVWRDTNMMFGDGYRRVELPARHALRGCVLHGLAVGVDVPASVPLRGGPSPLRFLFKGPGRTYWVRVVRYDEGAPIVASNWIELTVESDVSAARKEAVQVIEVLGLANKASGGAGGTWQFPYVEEAETAVLTLVDSRFQSNLPKWMREWADAVWISAGHEVRSWGGSGLAEVQPVRVYRACIELLEATDYWTEIPRTLPRQYASLRDRIQYSLDWAREESERQRRATWDTGSKERSDPATPDSDR